MTAVRVDAVPRRWRMRTPFVIAGRCYEHVDVIEVELTTPDGHRGRGEAAGVDYHGETVDSMLAEVARARAALERDPDRERLAALLPAGGARNALDAALWDLEAKRTGRDVFEALGVARPARVPTCLTIGIAPPEEIERRARDLRGHGFVKLKLDAELVEERVRALRAGHATARLIVDANASWTPAMLERHAPALAALGVEFVEQPLPPALDAVLGELRVAVPVCADESCQDLASLERLPRAFAYVNIKLDKCGGLTEGLRMLRRAREDGRRVMIGNMCGSSLAMAPAYVLAAQADCADLDGPHLQTDDHSPPMSIVGGEIAAPERELWG